MEESSPDESSPTLFISLTCRAIADQQYKEALRILKNGIEDAIQSGKTYDGQNLLQWFDGLITILYLNLEEAYGKDWEDKIEIPKIPEKVLRCSFCGKSQNKVKKLIAGSTVYICNECIDICNEIIADDASLKQG